MIRVLIFKESRFPADREKIRRSTENYLLKKISGNVEVGVSVVGDRKMKQLNRDFRKINETTDVLSFPVEDPNVSSQKDINSGFSPDKSSPDKIFRLGDVVVSYPQAVLGASENNKMVDQQIAELITHGLDHLLGIHHPD